jgi:hypothetical protein
MTINPRMILMGLIMTVLDCPHGTHDPSGCQIKKLEEMVKFTGKVERVGKWKAKEAIKRISSPMMGEVNSRVWIAKDPLLREAERTRLSFYKKIVSKDPQLANMKIIKDSITAFDKFLKKYGATVKEESMTMGVKTIRIVKNVKKVNISESKLKPPKGYTNISKQRPMMGPMMGPRGGYR